MRKKGNIKKKSIESMSLSTNLQVKYNLKGTQKNSYSNRYKHSKTLLRLRIKTSILINRVLKHKNLKWPLNLKRGYPCTNTMSKRVLKIVGNSS